MRLEWMASISPPPRAAIAARMQRRAFETVPYVPLGIRRTLTAYRQNISGLQKGSAPFAWNIRKG